MTPDQTAVEDAYRAMRKSYPGFESRVRVPEICAWLSCERDGVHQFEAGGPCYCMKHYQAVADDPHRCHFCGGKKSPADEGSGCEGRC